MTKLEDLAKREKQYTDRAAQLQKQINRSVKAEGKPGPERAARLKEKSFVTANEKNRKSALSGAADFRKQKMAEKARLDTKKKAATTKKTTAVAKAKARAKTRSKSRSPDKKK